MGQLTLLLIFPSQAVSLLKSLRQQPHVYVVVRKPFYELVKANLSAIVRVHKAEDVLHIVAGDLRVAARQQLRKLVEIEGLVVVCVEGGEKLQQVDLVLNDHSPQVVHQKLDPCGLNLLFVVLEVCIDQLVLVDGVPVEAVGFLKLEASSDEVLQEVADLDELGREGELLVLDCVNKVLLVFGKPWRVSIK